MFKKIIIYIFITILLFLIFYLYINNIKFTSIQTMSIPVTNKVVIIDAGHGSPDEGAEAKDGTTEASINLSISLKLQKILESSGCNVILTRSDENSIAEIDSKTISQKKVSDIKNRVSIANSSSADCFVSIHLNMIEQSQYWGWQTFYKPNDENSKLLATCIQDSLNQAISNNNSRIPHQLSNIYIMKNVEIPIALVECGFLSNEEEKNKLKTNEYQEKLAWGIYTGILDYFNSKQKN